MNEVKLDLSVCNEGAEGQSKLETSNWVSETNNGTTLQGRRNWYGWFDQVSRNRLKNVSEEIGQAGEKQKIEVDIDLECTIKERTDGLYTWRASAEVLKNRTVSVTGITMKIGGV